ncbi:hypothetical protein C2845_PM13G23160 [Panicum miliaceum]|uniref:Jacalin-type lectin domain-containing protein n=1 Tax=Panicum miliaceum TaxID=4540 RepID=A0A3L6RFG4_PANMI|nr:hypothetical protein C2845_PM13G23160 [Panicum miliaceum]
MGPCGGGGARDVDARSVGRVARVAVRHGDAVHAVSVLYERGGRQEWTDLRGGQGGELTECASGSRRRRARNGGGARAELVVYQTDLDDYPLPAPGRALDERARPGSAVVRALTLVSATAAPTGRTAARALAPSRSRSPRPSAGEDHQAAGTRACYRSLAPSGAACKAAGCNASHAQTDPPGGDGRRAAVALAPARTGRGAARRGHMRLIDDGATSPPRTVPGGRPAWTACRRRAGAPDR